MPPLRLEIFETVNDATDSTVVTDLNAMEEARLMSYEQGYTAGWEDAVEAQKGDKAQLAVDLAHNLQSLSFTYHEARNHVLKGMEPLLLGLVAQILPEIARSSLPAIVQQALLPIAEMAGDTPVKLLFNPAAREGIESLVDLNKGPPLVLVEEPTLGEGQVFLQLGDSETRVDLDGALAEIKDALTDFFTLSTKEIHNG